MRSRCENPTCGVVVPRGWRECWLCGEPVPAESPEESALRIVPINEGACASDVLRSRSVIRMSFKSRRPARLIAEE